MAAECCVTISKRISAVSGSKVTKSRLPCRGQTHCRLTLAFLFVHASFLSGDMGGVECGSRGNDYGNDFCPKFDVFSAPNFWGGPEIFVGHL